MAKRKSKTIYEYSQCPTCWKLDGEHTFDCVHSMLGTGIQDPKACEEAMIRALADDYD